jgi:hypothetical protein
MSKSSRVAQQRAAEGGKARKEAERRKAKARRGLAARRLRARRRAVGGAVTAVVAVLAVIAIMIAVKVGSGSSSDQAGGGSGSRPAPGSLVTALSSVPATVLDQVGRGQVTTPPYRLSGQPALTDGGKPLVLYMGAEYCPFCAAERWAVVVALSRFGTFSGLGVTHSAGHDVYPNTQTLSFHGATYTSQYLAFQGVETESNVRQGSGYAPLDSLTTAQQQTLAKYNATPYLPQNSAGSIPFVDFGNKYLISGASYSPQLLKGKSAAQIAAALARPGDPLAKAVDGTANTITAALCQLTGDQPAAVCTSPAVTAFAGRPDVR